MSRREKGLGETKIVFGGDMTQDANFVTRSIRRGSLSRRLGTWSAAAALWLLMSFAAQAAGGTPAITISVNPIPGYEEPATLEVYAEGSGDAGIEWIALYQNGVQLIKVNDYIVDKTVTGLPAGTYYFSATAKDFGGRTNTVTKQVVIQPANQAPTVSLSLPGGTQYLTPANITLASNPSDSDGSISKVEYFANGVWVAASMSPPFTAQWNNVSPGTYTLVASAYDNKNQHGNSAPVSVVVSTAEAEFAGQIVPVSMRPGAVYPVRVQMKNTGTSVWRNGDGYRLGSSNPGDNYTWGMSRAGLVGDVGPGQTAVFDFNVTAPASDGDYNFQWRMLKEGVQWFGSASANQVVQVRTPPALASEFVSQSVPTSMVPGATYSVSVQMRNVGTAIWRSSESIRLGSFNPNDNGTWNIARIPVAGDIAPGQVATFGFTVKAPIASGSYNFQWRMLKEGVAWFGDPSANQVVQVQAPPASSLLGVRTRYDVLGRVVSVKQDSELGVLTSTTEYLGGLQTAVTNPRGNVTLTAFHAFGAPSYDAPVVISSPEGVYTEIARDVFGKPTSLRRRNADQSLSLYRYLVYDANQRLCKSVEPETGATVTAYDDAGNPAWSAAGLSLPSTSNCDFTEAYSSGRRVDRSYDNRNRLEGLTFPDGRGNQSWLYTPDGLPREVTTSNEGVGQGVVVNTYGYNKRRLLSAESMSQPGSSTWTSTNGFDGNGNRSRYTTPDGLQVNYANNALGQPTAVSTAWGTHASGISYYPNGAIKQFTYGNGIVHSMTQNARQLPVLSVDAGVIDFSTGYDSNGNVTSISDRLRGDHYSRWMGYDNLDRLTSAGSCSFKGDCWHRFTYDVLDNIKTWSLGGVKNHRYLYNGNNHLTNIQSVNADGSTPTVIGLGYDVQGNLDNKNGQDYDFDLGNRLRKVTGKEIYRYDAYGRRVTATGRPDTTFSQSFYNQAGQLLLREEHHSAEAESDSHPELNIPHIYLGSSLLATLEWNRAAGNGQIKYQHTDALGSPVVVTNTAGQVLERTEWEPFGAAIREPGQPAYNGVGYTGHVMDGATGLTYMQQRYYDPAIGRFLSVDSVQVDSNSGDNFNRYSYVNNNPYKFIDPDGRQELEFLALRGVLAFAAADAVTPEPSDAAAPLKLAGYGAAIAGTAIGGAIVWAANEAMDAPADSGAGNTNPYNGPVDSPVVVVDSDGNAIPVEQGEQLKGSPDGRYQQVLGQDGKPTGTRVDKGGHRGQSDPKAQGPHGHRPGVTDETGNPHLPLNPPRGSPN
ncbi:RHS Repeat family protein [Lysobacter antibioticus]|uniref:RHS repeat domain-containing protein n=1 Tax=Lysobacter antibioticus TaxID=84531 RepID=UPI00071F732E|nr:RHS repeat-associated core domain-containing protein [Lysobacter antibioticus]ALN65148.1 RHS Repeat family protein [Lysobacter antibioticus]